jgi:hypothetical protein
MVNALCHRGIPIEVNVLLCVKHITYGIGFSVNVHAVWLLAFACSVYHPHQGIRFDFDRHAVIPLAFMSSMYHPHLSGRLTDAHVY